MKILKVLLFVLFPMQIVFADEPNFNNEEFNEAYIVTCFSEEHAKRFFGELPDKEIVREAKFRRKFIIDILKNGKEGLARTTAYFVKRDMEGTDIEFCYAVNNAKNFILKYGCYDFKNKTMVRDNGGIAACKELVDDFLEKSN